MEEAQEYGDSEENTQSQDKIEKSEFEALKAEIEALKTQQFYSQNNQAKEEPKTPQFSAEDLKAFQQNPELLARWIQNQAVEAKNEIKKESQKQVWDTRAYEKFPLLKDDKEFAKKVTSQMREMISQREYGKDDPMLLYRAAQIAAAEYAQATPKRNVPQNQHSSVESRSNTNTQRDMSSKSKIDNNDPRVKMAQAMGIQGEKLEKFKAQLGPHIPSNRAPKMRSVGR